MDSTVILCRDHRQIIFEWNNFAIINPLSLNTSNVFAKPQRPISGYLWNNLEITIAGTFQLPLLELVPMFTTCIEYNFSFVTFFPVTFVHTFFLSQNLASDFESCHTVCLAVCTLILSRNRTISQCQWLYAIDHSTPLPTPPPPPPPFHIRKT